MDKSKPASNFARAAIEAIRNILSQKLDMNIENLSKEFLATDSLFHEFLSDYGKNSVDVKESNDFYELMTKNKKLEAQKQAFFRDYEELNYRKNKEKEFYNRAILFLSDFAKTSSENSVKEDFEKFRSVLKKNQSVDVLDLELSSLKSKVMKYEMDAAQQNDEKKGFLNKFKFSQSAESGNDYIAILKETYKDIIEKINLSVDKNCAKSLSALASGINNISSPDDFFILRKNMLEILGSYLQSVDDGREEAASFIKEIGQRLLEVEGELLKTYITDSDEKINSNKSFTSLLEEHLNDLNKNVSLSKTLEEVKSAVVSKLNTMKIVIHRKKAEDKKYHDNVETKINNLEKKLAGFKEEVKKAKLKSVSMEKDLLLDPLTGAYNRRAYNRRINEEIARFFRYKTKFSMILFDIDHFKNINDTYGHDIGDKCLFEIIRKVSPLLRKSDLIARYGGEEFIIILPELTLDGAERVAEKVRSVVEEISFVYKKENIKLTISLGVGEINENDKGAETFFSRIDKALYEAKSSGRNRVVLSK
ncbi:MAG: hypothetical protein CSA18_03160 [Deltaproteobacteria bacterium]|nr:MAG: hypothetical protein CSA18_03160 [Deltaproteobacteria bacterium]